MGVKRFAFKEIARDIKPASGDVARCKKDLYYLSTEILGYKDVNPELHKEYCDFVSWRTNPAPKKLDLMPREHLKTTLGTVGLSIQEIINDPDITILIASFKWEKAREMLGEVKDHLENNVRFKKMFGSYRGSDRQWNEDKIYVSKRTKPNKTATIDTSGLECTLTSAHYRRIILDDLVCRANIGTYKQVMQVVKFYQDALDLLDKRDGKLIIHGTRWAFHELYAWLLKNHKKDFALYIRRAVEKGRIIYPERFTRDSLKELKRAKGLWDFSCQYFNFTYDTQNALVRSREVQYYTANDLKKYQEKYPIFVTMVVDGAVTEDTDSCETAITIVGTTIWDEWILLDERVGHWGPTEAIEEMIGAIVRWQPQVFGIQKTTFEKLYRLALERELSERKLYSPEMVMLSKNPRITKHQQIMSLKPRIERKGLYWLQSHERFEMAARQYPKTTELDVLDSLSRHTEISEVPFFHKHKASEREFVSLKIDPERLPWNL